MTTFEHALLGINAAVACGLHRRYGWRIPALAGIASISPDWDGLTILASVSAFDRYHRVIGHNFLVATVVAAALAIVEHRFNFLERSRRLLESVVEIPSAKHDVSTDKGEIREKLAADTIENDADSGKARAPLYVAVTVCVFGALTHLAEDIVVSGGDGLSDWHLQLLWPFSQAGFVYPLIAWGDPTVSLILIAAMFGQIWRPRSIRLIAIASILAVAAYIGIAAVDFAGRDKTSVATAIFACKRPQNLREPTDSR